jgi:hypothetical protein
LVQRPPGAVELHAERDAGQINVTTSQTADPTEIGPARICLTARMRASSTIRGYNGLLGWIQLVRSTDNHSAGARFEIDPLEILGTVSRPFCFFGIKPILFDAPA